MYHSHFRTFLICIIILSAVSFTWLTAHIFESYPWQGQYQQRDPDAMLFTRLLEQSLLRGKISDIDSYGCYPYKIKHGFAPFYMYFLVNATGLFYTLFPDCGFDPIMVAGVLPILFAWFSGVVILFVLWRLSKNYQLVLLSAFFMLPGLAASMTGELLKLDYDFLISFYIWAWLLTGSLYIHKPKDYLKIAGGLIVALFMATWIGTPFFFFFVTIYGFYLWLARLEDADDYLVYASSTMLIGGLLNIVYMVNSGIVTEAISFGKYSYFQPLCIVAGGTFLFLLKFLERFKKPRTVGLAVLLVIAIGAWFVFHEQIMQSTGLLLQKDPIHSTITELVPVVNLSKLATSSKVSSSLTDYFGWTIFLLPFFVLLKPRGFSGTGGRFLRDWLVIMMLLSIHQVRFLRWLGIGAGLFSGIAVNNLWKMVSFELGQGKWRNLKLVLIFLPLFVIFSLQSFSIISSRTALADPQIEAFNWIARNTPQTSGYADDKEPEYSILSYWDEGNLLAYYTRRPVVVNNAMWGFKTMADIFSATNEDEAFALCREYGVKYIYLSSYRQHADKSYGFWPYFKNQPRQPEYHLIYKDVPISKDFKKWFYFWLLDHLALTPKGGFGAGTRFRVVYAAKVGEQTLPPYFLFERVEGARCNMTVDPESEVSISIEVKFSNQDFIYKVNKKADKNGQLILVLPYSTSHHGGRVYTDPFYKLGYRVNGKLVKAKLQVKDAEVVKGLELDLKASLEELPGE